MVELDFVLFEYVTHSIPKPNEHVKHFLKRYPRCYDAVIELTANWRAFSVLDRLLPCKPEPGADRQHLQRARTHKRRLLPTRLGARPA
jgi:hypothetical protein